MKEFRTTGPCIAEKHYMVDISDRIKRIRKMVDDGQYFTIGTAAFHSVILAGVTDIKTFNKKKSPGIVKTSVNGKELVEILV